MNIKNIEKIIKEIISKKTYIKKKKIKNFNFLLKDLNIDSLDKIDLIISLEKKFNIKISDEIFEKINTVQSAIDCVKILLKK